MTIDPPLIEPIRLNVATSDEIASYVGAVKMKDVWWRAISKGFYWPFEIHQILDEDPRLPLLKAFIGYQYLTSSEKANSKLNFLAIPDMQEFDISKIKDKHRSMVRKAVKSLIVSKVETQDPEIANKARLVWNDLVERTGWREKMTAQEFQNFWYGMIKTPGHTLITVSTPEGEMAGWLVGGLNADGIASIYRYAAIKKLFNLSPNNLLIYAFLISAKNAGAKICNFGLAQPGESTLDDFKLHQGFQVISYPAKLRLNPFVAPLIRIFKPVAYKRLTGKE